MSMSNNRNLRLSLKDCMKKNRRKIPLVFIYIEEMSVYFLFHIKPRIKRHE